MGTVAVWVGLGPDVGASTHSTQSLDRMHCLSGVHDPSSRPLSSMPSTVRCANSASAPIHTKVVQGFDLRAHLGVSTLMVDENLSRAGQHEDPPGPMPALVCGASGHRWCTSTGAWEPVQAGGWPRGAPSPLTHTYISWWGLTMVLPCHPTPPTHIFPSGCKNSKNSGGPQPGVPTLFPPQVVDSMQQMVCGKQDMAPLMLF